MKYSIEFLKTNRIEIGGGRTLTYEDYLRTQGVV
jgi:hypothetical protein